MEAAISNGSCDVIGLGRPAAVYPKAPKLILNKDVPTEEVDMHLKKIRAPFLVRAMGIRILAAGTETVSW